MSSPAFTYTLTQRQLNIPCYRGFSTFWYGDTWLNIENLLSKYDSASNKRKFYFTDDATKFSNDISNKENVVEVNPDSINWAKEIIIGNNANLITSKNGNQNFLNCYKWDNKETGLHVTLIGGATWNGEQCGLASMSCHYTIPIKQSFISFVKCCILD